MNTTNKPNILYWVIAVIALLWNAMGAKAYLDQAFRNETFMTSYTPEQIAIVDALPIWVTAAFAVAVWFGLLGAIFLLLRRSWAKPFFLISLIGVFVQMGYTLFMGEGADNYGPGGISMILMIIVGAILFLWYSNYAKTKGWLK
ncbi:MAG: hypothetical protein R2781_02430 [Flavobacteriaceae bacterium]